MFFICNVPDLNPQVSFLLEYLHKSYLQHYSLYQYLLTTPQQMDYTQLVKEASCLQWARGAGRADARYPCRRVTSHHGPILVLAADFSNKIIFI